MKLEPQPEAALARDLVPGREERKDKATWRQKLQSSVDSSKAPLSEFAQIVACFTRPIKRIRVRSAILGPAVFGRFVEAFVLALTSRLLNSAARRSPQGILSVRIKFRGVRYRCRPSRPSLSRSRCFPPFVRRLIQSSMPSTGPSPIASRGMNFCGVFLAKTR